MFSIQQGVLKCDHFQLIRILSCTLSNHKTGTASRKPTLRVGSSWMPIFEAFTFQICSFLL